MSGDLGPRDEKPKAPSAAERKAEQGDRGLRAQAAGAVRASPLRPALHAQLWGPAAGGRSCRSRLPGGRPCWSLGGKVGSTWFGERRWGEEMRQFNEWGDKPSRREET